MPRQAFLEAFRGICKFDLALLSEFTGLSVEHQECMAKGGHVCRFKFKPGES